MNWLVKEITEPFISTTGEKIILIPGGFKPPTLGHFHIVNEMAKKNEIDKVIVLIGHKIRDGITKEQSLEIWNIYKSYLPSKVIIIISDKISPIGDVINIIKNNSQNFYYPVVGIRGEEDEGDLKRFNYLKDKYTNYKPIIFNSDLNISGTRARRALLDGDFEIFKNFIPSELTEADKMKVWNILNNKMINENLTYSQHIDYKQIVDEVLDYFKNKYSLSSLPTIEYVDGDVENAKTIFTKTGHYDPATKTIVLYTEGRHPRDLINTLCHELIHFLQDLKGELDNIQTQNTMEDDYLNQIEREAYEEGGILFRNWKDSVKNSSNTQEYTDLLTQQLAEALIPQSPLEKSLRIKYNDVLEKLIIFEKNNHIEVNQIRINNQHKNQGYGTKIMNDIIEHANKTLKVITLTPTNDFGSDELRLIEFYKRLGFVKNKNNREYLDTYIKYPKYI
jgi:ribosomal protein S18 acetylase RimI-like enzyme